MDYKLADLIDIELLQDLQEKLNLIYSFPSAIIDNDGTILTAVAWQDVCTKFHRKDPVCARECVKSDRYINEHLNEASPAVSYKCPHGLVDNAAPIIINGKHLGNFFTGQFFLEKPDIEFFRKQANKYGFDENAYLDAVEKVPVWSNEKLHQYLDFIKGFIEIIAGIGLKNLKEKEINKVLEEKENRHKSILKLAMDGFCLVNIHGQIMEVNEAFCRVSGYSEAELLNMSLPDLEAQDTAEIIEQRLKVIISKGEERFFSKHKRKNGDVYDVEVSVKCQTYPELAFIAFMRDVTEQKVAEQQLCVSEERLRNALEATTDAIWEWDIVSGNTYFSPRWYEILGYKQGEIEPSAKEWVALSHPDDRDIALKTIFEAIANGNNYEVQFRSKHADGHWVWCLVKGKVTLRDEAGKPIRMSGTNSDITLRKEYEQKIIESREELQHKNDEYQSLNEEYFSLNEELTENNVLFQKTIAELEKAKEKTELSEEKYRTLFENSSNGIVIINPQTTSFIEFNDQVCSQLGYSRDEFAKLTIRDIEAIETSEETNLRIKHILDTGGAEFETKQIAKNGDIKDIHVSARIIIVAGKKVYHCIWRDITEFKKNELAIIAAKEKAEISETRFKALFNNMGNSASLYEVVLDRRKVMQSGCVDYISKPLNVKNLLTLVSKYLI